MKEEMEVIMRKQDLERKLEENPDMEKDIAPRLEELDWILEWYNVRE